MKKIFGYILAVMAIACVSTACSDDQAVLVGEGKVKLSMIVDDNVDVLSRAISSEEKAALEQSCKIYVYSSKGLIRKYRGIDEVPADMWLVSGEYKAEAWAGDSVTASFDKKYYRGITSFTVSPTAVANAKIECKIANVVTSVKFDASVATALADYKVVISNTKGSLEFTDATAGKKGYFMMPDNDTKLVYTITGTNIAGETYTQSGEILEVKGATEYAITVKFNGKEFDPLGGSIFEVIVDESEIVANDSFELQAAPRISAPFDISKPKVGEAGSFSKFSVYVSAVADITSLTVSGLSSIGYTGGDAVSYFDCEEYVKAGLKDFGVDIQCPYNSSSSAAKITFAAAMLNKLANGTYRIGIVATDKNEKVRNATLVIEVSNDALKVTEVPGYDVWATSATISGNLAKANASDYGVQYRKAGGSWEKVYASGTSFRLELTGLEPGTTYEYCAFADNDGEGREFVSGKTYTFTTESAQQLPNSGFEDWCKPNKAILPAASEGDLYWDSGNHGSATMSKNITQSDATVKNSGNYSAKLESQFVGMGAIGKFAAGNLFTGKYLKTDGTDGVLGFGRQGFNSRPKSLSAYVKYIPGKVDNINSEAKANGCVEGANDMGTIYVAILTDYTESYGENAFPVVIKTKSSERRLFSKNDSNVIAFGQWTCQESTSDDNSMIKIDIPLEYYRTDVKASAILVVCSSSYWGDYFSGGSSVMYVDDISLNY